MMRLALILALFAGPVSALQCGEHSAIADMLLKKYSEEPMARGVDASGRLMEVYASDEKGTWTVVLTQPGRPSCIVAAGVGFEIIDRKVGEPT